MSEVKMLPFDTTIPTNIMLVATSHCLNGGGPDTRWEVYYDHTYIKVDGSALRRPRVLLGPDWMEPIPYVDVSSDDCKTGKVDDKTFARLQELLNTKDWFKKRILKFKIGDKEYELEENISIVDGCKWDIQYFSPKGKKLKDTKGYVYVEKSETLENIMSELYGILRGEEIAKYESAKSTYIDHLEMLSKKRNLALDILDQSDEILNSIVNRPKKIDFTLIEKNVYLRGVQRECGIDRETRGRSVDASVEEMKEHLPLFDEEAIDLINDWDISIITSIKEIAERTRELMVKCLDSEKLKGHDFDKLPRYEKARLEAMADDAKKLARTFAK